VVANASKPHSVADSGNLCDSNRVLDIEWEEAASGERWK
jgi:hypothetical protein